MYSPFPVVFIIGYIVVDTTIGASELPFPEEFIIGAMVDITIGDAEAFPEEFIIGSSI